MGRDAPCCFRCAAWAPRVPIFRQITPPSRKLQYPIKVASLVSWGGWQ